ncbi:hypothetical protein [Streptomyces agglomeratus]|uniref:hypothetical protein n=1 Tax=Streptomyces agglomeratus TaxID=285458 RepID=UPI00114D1845|nr:hypothetical protein [Streptomyces agglomeratus]
MGIDWGDVPTWLGGTFAAIAAYGAVATMRSQRRQIEEQRQFLRAQTALLSLDHRQRTQAQALKVSLEARTNKDLGKRWWTAYVDNWSDAPISDVQLSFGVAAPESAGTRHGGAAGGALELSWFLKRPRSVDLDAHISIGARGRVWFFSVSWREHQQPGLAPILEFTDTNNLRWRLDHYGDLTELGSGDSGAA